MTAPPSIVVFSHLRWSFVYQRPQHLLSRFAADRRVYFIEEPLFEKDCHPYWNLELISDGLTVCQFHSPLQEQGFLEKQLALMQPCITELISLLGLEDYVLWFYSPLALPLACDLLPQAIVYDCMDELSAFLNAPPQLLAREQELLDLADVVFTGGRSLYTAKKDRNWNVHCFPSSVDVNHFGQSHQEIAEPEVQKNLERPRLGFFGVIDERIDLRLIEELASAHPEWQIIMVGPVVKIDPTTLPRQSNIHYFGQQPYADLPNFIAGWDICLLPFARNASTKYISPTKTLEYMAAEKLIVSTPITDVVEPYGELVFIGETPKQFIAACESALSVTPELHDKLINKMRTVLSGTSWDRTVKEMSQRLDDAMELKAEREVLPPDLNHRETSAQSAPVVIIGAGPTGLSAAYHCGDDALLLEQNDRIGGWCRSIELDGFTFDYAGHIMFSNDPYVHEMYAELLGENVHWQDREAWIYSKNVYTRYPFQGALYGLPPDVIKECLIGAIESRYGLLGPDSENSNSRDVSTEKSKSRPSSENGNGNGSMRNCAKEGVSLSIELTSRLDSLARENLGPMLEDCCGDGILESTALPAYAEELEPGTNGNGKSRANGRHELPKEQTGAGPSFEEFIYKVWGAGIAKHFAIPYNQKLWSIPLSEMETSWLGGRVPLPDLGEMIEGALKPVPKPMGPNARFGYPLHGGFQALMNGFLSHVNDRLRLNTRVVAISPSRRLITLSDGSKVAYEQLISTMPLPLLIQNIGDEAPAEIREATAKLRYVSVRCVHIGVGREELTGKHWIYYPESTVFHRIFVQGNASPHCNPVGGFGLTCEITYSPFKPLPCAGDELTQRCIADCIEVGLIRKDDPIWVATQCDLPHAYVVYDFARKESVKLIRDWLATGNIQLAGRYSEWEYYNSDHAFLAGKNAAEQALATLGKTLVIS